ncbi:hypothetical protein AVZ31_11675 [Mycolicibacterium neoaurum]|uniref:Uncharacterized protein n=1 Tax=Mycolicibacterium neoaurum VKM Ac-1815D TaxID=700508 RepID=V5XJ62_MYCNE|nr:hypothetical protein AVZ31_11675 [Mycolicibacterium neoaurum]
MLGRRTKRVYSAHHRFGVDLEECSGSTQLVVLLVGDDLILDRGVDESVDEFSVCPCDSTFIKSQLCGDVTERAPLVRSELEVGHRAIQQLHIRRDVHACVHATG